MKGNAHKLAGAILIAFSTGILAQIFLPDIFIVAIFACIALFAGILLLKY